ncbi:MAG: hypothetical protein NC418_04080 [Muribaculaceae bacterium]|nr:hypothetical protein [Muribaculaceae bacterium]
MKTDNRSGIAAILAPVALIIIFAATLAPFFLREQAWAQAAYPYVYAAGALMLLLVRLFTPYRGKDLKLKRWHRIESWSAIFFCAAAVFLFIPGAALRDWLAFTLAAAMIQLITSLMIPAREAKIAKG